MKKSILKPFAIAIFAVIAAVAPTFGKASFGVSTVRAETFGSIVNRKETVTETNGLTVKTSSGWKQGSATNFSVKTGEIIVPDGGFLAIELKLAKVNYDYFVCHGGENGTSCDRGDA